MAKTIGEKLRDVVKPMTKTEAEQFRKDRPGIKALIAQGMDANFAHYSECCNATAFFGMRFSRRVELRTVFAAMKASEDEYMPSFPPMSPLSDTYFQFWGYYDLRIPKTAETIGTCEYDSADLLKYDETHKRTLKNLIESRMGIYEHLGFESGRIRLRDLCDGKEYSCVCSSGYNGKSGEIWLATYSARSSSNSRLLEY